MKKYDSLEVIDIDSEESEVICAGCGQSWSNRAEKMQEAIWAELKSG